MQTGIPDALVDGSHRLLTRVSSWRGGRLLAADIPVISGKWTAGTGTQVQGSITLETSAGWQADDVDAPLAPYGQRLHVEQVLSAGGADHVIDIGWFLITRAVINPAGNLRVDAADLMQLVVDDRFTSPRQPPAGATFLSETVALAGGWFPVASAVADRPLAGLDTSDWTEDRAAALNAVEVAWPAWFRLDRGGVLRVEPKPAVGEPVRAWAHGQQGAYITRDESFDRAGIYNAVVVRGRTAEGVDIAATATSTDPGVGWASPFGRRPMFAFSPLATTQERAQAEADTRAARLAARFREVVVTAPPDPRIDLGDTVRIVGPDGTARDGLVTGIDLPFTPGAAQWTVAGVPW